MRSPSITATIVALSLQIASAWHVFGQAADRPNIVLIMADDLGYECIGANGSTSYQTPHLDRLAATGMRFEHCHVQPLCTPTRVQLMTGLYNQRNYLRFGLLDPEAITFAHLFQQAGYATCVVGKWQLQGGYEGPGHFGFDEYCLWQLNRRPSRYANPGLEINGRQVDYDGGEYGPDLVSDYLCDFIDRHRDKPFLAYYPMILPHAPYEPTPDSQQWDPTVKGVRSEIGNRRFFADMVAYCDRIVGKMVAKLDETGLRERTLVIFLGDNGTGPDVVSRMGDREVRGGKGRTIDAGTHVPLIVNWSGRIPAGRVCSDLVDSTDFFPTLLAAAGIREPREPLRDGRSFLPQLLGEPGQPRPWIYSWYSRNGGPHAVELARNHRFKLYRGGGLFDVVADPKETRPLTGASLSTEARQARELLQAALDQYQGTGRAATKPKKR
jgi:arylsulfatase A